MIFQKHMNKMAAVCAGIAAVIAGVIATAAGGSVCRAGEAGGAGYGQMAESPMAAEGALNTDSTLNADSPLIAGGTDRFLDAVLVIDCSGSLDMPVTGTDPEKLALEAAGLFTDMAEAERTRIGLVAFSDRIEMEMPLTPLSSEDGRERLREAVRGLDYDYTGDTDLGAGASAAVGMLTGSAAEDKKLPDAGTDDAQARDASADDVDARDASADDAEAQDASADDAEAQDAGADAVEPQNSGAARALLFFTDGWIDLPRAADPEAAEAESEEKLRDALRSARENGVRVYTILLGDAAASFDPVFEGSRIFHIGQAQELPSVYMDIFAELIGARPVSDGARDIVIREPGTSAGTDFSIPPAPEGSIEEANVILISPKPLAQIQVYDPDGALLSPQISLSAHYSLVKLIKPSSGTYHLEAVGEEPCTVSVNLLFNSSVILRCSVTDAQDEDKAKITAWFEYGGEPVTDPEICEAFSASAFVTASDEETEIPLRFLDGGFICEAAAPPGVSLKVRVHALSEDTERWSEAEAYVNERYPGISCRPPEGDIMLRGLVPERLHCEIHLDDHFRAWDGSPLSWEISADNECAVISEKNDTLSISGRERGTARVKVTASDEYGSRARQEFTVTFQTVFSSSRMAVTAAAAGGVVLAALLCAAGIFYAIRSRDAREQGILLYSLRAEGLFLSEEKSRFDLSRMEKRREDMSRIAARGKDGPRLHMPGKEVSLCRGPGGPSVRCGKGECRLVTEENTTAARLKLRGRTRFTVCWEEDGRKAEMRCLYIPGEAAECTKPK